MRPSARGVFPCPFRRLRQTARDQASFWHRKCVLLGRGSSRCARRGLRLTPSAWTHGLLGPVTLALRVCARCQALCTLWQNCPLPAKGGFSMALASLFTLATLFSFSVDVGTASGPKFVVMSITLFNQTLTYDGLQLLLILGISIVAAVLVEQLAGRATPGGILGAFFIALIGIWIFLTFIPLVWRGDYNVDGIPLITAVIGAILSILV